MVRLFFNSNSLVFTVVDQNSNIVCSTTHRNLSLTPLKQITEGQTLMVGKGFSLWTPSSKKNISIMDVWKDATYFVTLPIAGTTWTLLTEMPVAPLQRYLYQATIVNLSLIFCLFVVAIILSQIVSSLLVRTPVRLAAISQDIPGKLEKSAELTWPESNITEMDLLIENFKETTHALSLQYQNIKDTNIHLEERVQERTIELRESEERFAQLAEQSRSIAWEVDAQGLYTFVSQVSEAVLGYRPDELMGRMHFYVLHPESGREAFKQAAFAVFERKELFQNLVNAVQTKDGRQVWVSTNGTPLLNADGTLRGYRGSNTDITERKQAEEALRESEEKYRIIFNNEIYAICIFDLETLNLLDVNQAFTNLYSYSREELISGMTIHDITAEEKNLMRQQLGQSVRVQFIFHFGIIEKRMGLFFRLKLSEGRMCGKGEK
jgi:PAS domain S-box-containing protein